jgi:tetratricopeptide (TPR) repeat protein
VNEFAEFLVALGRIPEAITEWKLFASQMGENDPDHWWALGEIARLRGDWAQAAQLYRRGGELAGYPYAFLEREGLALMRAGELGGALGKFQQAVRVYPKGIWSYWYAGDIERSRGHNSQAKAWYEAAIQAQPNHPQSYLYLAVLAFGDRNYQLAAEYLATARAKDSVKEDRRLYSLLEGILSLPPDKVCNWYIEAAEHFAMVEKPAEAIMMYRRALELDPHNVYVRDKLRELMEKMPVVGKGD